MFNLWFADSSGGPRRVGAGPVDKQPADDSPDLLEDEDLEGGVVSGVLMDLMPWALAVLLHAAIILLSIFIAWQTGVVSRRGSEGFSNEIRLAPGGGGGGGGSDAALGDPNDKGRGKLTLHEDPLSKRNDVHAEPTPVKVKQTLDMVGMDAAARNPEFKIAAITNADGGAPGGQIFYKQGGGGFGRGNNGGRGGGEGGGTGTGRGRGRGTGIGDGDQGPITYCFIIDASGSLIEGMPYVIDQLKEFIHNLIPDEEFAIFFFQEGLALQVVDEDIRPVTEHQGFKAATDFNKERALKALDKIHPQGTSSPKEALRIAFSKKYPPAIVYLLSDNITSSGQYELRQSALLKDFESYNGVEGSYVPMPGGKGGMYRCPPSVIHAVQYLSPDPLLKQGFKEATLQKVVEENDARRRAFFQKWAPKAEPPPGGTYKYIDPADLFGKD